MKRAIVTLSLVGVAGLLAAVWLFSGGERRGGVRPAPSEVEAGRQVAAMESPVLAPVAAGQDAPRESERVAVEESAAAEPGNAAGASSARAKVVAVVRGRCIDAGMRPLAEVEVTGPGIADGQRTAADGGFEVEVDLSGELRLTRDVRFARASLGTRHIQSLLRAGESTDLGDVVLLPVGRVSGRVVDGQGLALGGAKVRVEEALDLASGSRFTGPEDAIATGVAAANGRFLLEEVPSGAVRVWAGLEEWSWSATERLELAPGGLLADLELVLAPLEPEDTIRLQVLDPAGAPVPRAEIHYLYEIPERSSSGNTQADEHGRYEQFLDVRASYTFQASDPEKRYSPAVAYDVQPGTHDLVLQLGEKRSFRLKVEDEAGAPVARFQARANQERGRFSSFHEPPGDGSLPPGEVEIVTPVATFGLTIEAEGFELTKLGPFDPDGVPGKLVAHLKALPGVRGRVTSADGPVAGAKISLHEAMGSSDTYTVNGFLCVMEKFPEAEAQADEDGEYVLTLRESGDWYVRAEAPGFAPGDLGPVRLEAGAGARDLDLVLGRGGTIAGRVIVPAGQERSGHIVGLSRGDGHGFTGRTDAAGEFRFAGLTPGNWQVAWRKSEISTSSTTSSRSSGGERAPEIPWDCLVHEGQTAHFDLDLRALQLATLSGRFLLGGSAPRDWSVGLHPRDDPTVQDEDASLDPNGRFLLTTPATGSATLVFRGELGGSLASARADIRLAPGENVYEADVPAGSLRGRLRLGSLDPGARLDFISEAYPGLSFRANLHPDSTGSFGAELLPAGPARIEYVTASGEKGTKTLEVPQGRALEVDLP